MRPTAFPFPSAAAAAAAALILMLALPGPAAVAGTPAGVIDTSAGPVRVETMAEGLDEPWSLAFLPDGRFLVTERGGRLGLYPAAGGEGRPVAGLPEVFARGQGGLFDVLVPRDFAQSRELLISYAGVFPEGGATVLAAARLDGDRLEGLHVLWQMAGPTGAGVHFGGRLAELADGTLLLSIGERGEFDPAQDPAAARGKVLRLNRDGSAPADNPFPQGPIPQIFTLGHRNPQGLTVDAGGTIWEREHGARGGDEINRLRPGANYGWPVIAYGVNYDGSPIGRGRAAPGMEQPAHYWDPSIAPSGHMVYSGRLWPGWAGDHFLGSLKFDYLARLDPDSPGPGGWAEERIASPATGRVRDVREAPDGAIWMISVGRGAVYRLTPAPGP